MDICYLWGNPPAIRLTVSSTWSDLTCCITCTMILVIKMLVCMIISMMCLFERIIRMMFKKSHQTSVKISTRLGLIWPNTPDEMWFRVHQGSQ